MNAHLFSVTLLIAVFLRSWLFGLRRSITNCAESQSLGTDVFSIGKDIAWAVISGFAIMLCILFFMFFVEVIILGVIRQPIEFPFLPKLHGPSIGMRIIASWVTDWRLCAAIMLAAGSSVLFSSVVLQVVGWNADDLGMPPPERTALFQRTIVAIYVFLLFAMILFLVYQLWLSSAAVCKKNCMLGSMRCS